MAVNPFTQFVFDLFIISAIIITAYTVNFYYLAFISRTRKEVHPTIDWGTPSVTIQLPIYNEKYVAKRLVDAVCNLDYPQDKLRIMVCDDSDDDTVELLRGVVDDYKKQGYQIEHVRRGTRKGYKAGALKHAMQTTDTDLVAIFDADFIPPTWFLKRAIPHFSKSNIGLVQCRWGHVNENYSTITQVQALSIDFHFLVEQKAKSNSHLFMNFNGTAGIWRRECIEDAGGWHTATLVEDLDLSYRAQMKGWKCLFLPDIVVDAELPAQINGAKRQQFRWAKGSIQCAIKLLFDIGLKRNVSIETARIIVTSQIGGDIHSDDIIVFQKFGAVSVTDVLSDLNKYDLEACADPGEPEYGTSKAILYANNGAKPIIHSVLHWGRNYFLRSPEGNSLTVEQLALLPPLEYDSLRKGAAKAMGVRISVLDNEVLKLRENEPAVDAAFEKIEPWSSEVNGIEFFLRI